MSVIRTYKDIQDAVIDRASLEDSEAVRTKLKEKINTKYYDVIFEDKYRWLSETKAIKLKAKYTTGTVAATNGSDIITGTGTGWTEIEHLYSRIRVGGLNVPFKIIRVDEGAQTIVLDAPYTDDTATGLTYILYKDEYGLFPDMQDIRMFNIPGLIGDAQPRPIGPDSLDRIRNETPFRNGTPRLYTIDGKSHYNTKTWGTWNLGVDFFEEDFDEAPEQLKLVIWPGILNKDRIAQVRYTKRPRFMQDDLDEPLIPLENRPVLVYGVLLESYLKARDIQMKREWEKMYEDYKLKMRVDAEDTDDKARLFYSNKRHGFSNRFSRFDFDSLND